MRVEILFAQESPMYTVNPTPKQLNDLNYWRYHHPCPGVQRHMEIVWLASVSTMPYQDIARCAGVCPNTVTSTLKRFLAQGVNGLLIWNNRGSKSATLPFHHLLREKWDKHPPATLAIAAQQLKEVTGIRRSPRATASLLRKLGFSRRKAGSRPAKADPDAQRQCLAQDIEPALEQARRGREVVFFMDAAHFVFGAFLGYVWCLIRVFVATAAGRQRYNVLGAVDIIGQRMVSVANTTYITAETVCDLLKKIRLLYVGRPIRIFLDNARYQRCALVMETARCLDITLSFLPTYSPNLNLIERFWKHVKKACLTNVAHPDFQSFRNAIDACLHESFTTNRAAMKTLLAPNFQIIPESQKRAS